MIVRGRGRGAARAIGATAETGIDPAGEDRGRQGRGRHAVRGGAIRGSGDWTLRERPEVRRGSAGARAAATVGRIRDVATMGRERGAENDVDRE